MGRWSIGTQVVAARIPEDHLETDRVFDNGDYGIVVATHGTVEGVNGRFALLVTVRTMHAGRIVTALATSDELNIVGAPVGFVTDEETLNARIAYHDRVGASLREWRDAHYR